MKFQVTGIFWKLLEKGKSRYLWESENQLCWSAMKNDFYVSTQTINCVCKQIKKFGGAERRGKSASLVSFPSWSFEEILWWNKKKNQEGEVLGSRYQRILLDDKPTWRKAAWRRPSLMHSENGTQCCKKFLSTLHRFLGYHGWGHEHNFWGPPLTSKSSRKMKS